MSKSFFVGLGSLVLLFVASSSVTAQVRISEIMYHPSSENPAEEYLELVNTSATNVSLAGWRIVGGLEYAFGAPTLGPGGYLVVAADTARFAARYPGVTNVVGGWVGTLSNSRDTVRLENPAGKNVDSVSYADQGDWAVRQRSVSLPVGAANGFRGWVWFAPHDGLDYNTATSEFAGGSSLELINPRMLESSGQNWASSVSNGTPGRVNSAYSTNTAPVILETSHFPAVPGPTNPVTITARILSADSSAVTAQVFYRNHSATNPPAFSQVPMFDDGAHGDGLAGDRIFAASSRSRTTARSLSSMSRLVDSQLRIRTWPAAARQLDGSWAQTCNALYQVDEDLSPATVSNSGQPFYRIITTETERAEFARLMTVNPDSDAEKNCTFITVDGTGVKVRYNCSVRVRGEGSRGRTPPPWRMNIPTDRPWNDLTAVNLNTQFIHAQMLGSAFALRSGLPAAEARVVQVRLNGVNYARSGLPSNGTATGSGFGSYAMLEPINNELAGHRFPADGNGNVYRASIYPYYANLAYEGTNLYNYTNANTGGYTKTSNKSENDWSDLVDLAYVLSTNLPDPGYVIAVSNRVNVSLWLRYFAVCNLLEFRETSMCNGLGDDYAMYRGILDPRFMIVAHDFDTILGQGDYTAFNPSASIWLMLTGWHGEADSNLELRATYLFRMLRHPDFAPVYFAELKRLCDTVFEPGEFDRLIHGVLGGWVPENIIDDMRTFAGSRRASVLSQLPLGYSVNVPLATSSGYFRTTNRIVTLHGTANAIDTRTVTVNGAPGNWTVWQGRWTNSLALNPGINNVFVKCLRVDGAEAWSTNTTIWYDDGSIQAVSGAVLADTTWTAAAGPYQVTGTLTVENGATLTIEPGTTVYMGSGANLVVASGGRLVAEGTETANIRFASVPGSGTSWGGFTVFGGEGSPETRFAYTRFEGNSATCIQVTGGSVALDHSVFLTATRQYLSLDQASFLVSDCYFPSAAPGEYFELVHGSGGVKAGGRGVFLRNFFGVANSISGDYNDAIDFTGGNRDAGQPIIQFYDNVFIGSGDDLIDLDGTDGWIEGNIFLHTHRNGSPDSASAISGGLDQSNTSELTIVRNFFFDCDHAVTAKEGNFYTLLNNTVVRVTQAGGVDTASAVVNLADEGTAVGAGFYLEGNVIADAAALARNYNPAVSLVTYSNNVLPVAWSGPGGGNLIVAPRFQHVPSVSEAQFTTWSAAQIVKEWLSLAPGSPGSGTGPGGLDQGAAVAGGVTLSGGLAPVTPARNAEFTVGTLRTGSGIPAAGFPVGSGYTHYQWRLNGGSWSAETPLHQTLRLTNLAIGTYQVEVRGKRDSNDYQDAPDLGASAIAPATCLWKVNDKEPSLRLNELLARNSFTWITNGESPDLIELFNTGPDVVDLAGKGLTDDFFQKYKFTFAPGSTLAPGQFQVLFSEASGDPARNVGFSFKAEGGTLYLFDSPANGGSLIDVVTFGPQLPDRSIGRTDQGSWSLCRPTFGARNRAEPTGDCFKLRINEWLALGSATMPDDFIELFNPDAAPVALGGLYLTDEPVGAPDRHEIAPLSYLDAGSWFAFKADGNTNSGPEHLNFKLKPEQGRIGLSAANLAPIDQVAYGPQTVGVSMGRAPDGAPELAVFGTPTPGSGNPGGGGIQVTNLTTTYDFITVSNTWRYHTAGMLPAADWKETNYLDAAWSSGRGLLGYEATPAVYPYAFLTPLSGSNGPTSIITYYFRTTFEVPTNLAGFTINATAFVDDGAVFYLNGAEVARLRITNSPVVYTNLAANQPAEGTRESLTISNTAFRVGANWLAVEVHQTTLASTDVAFGMGLSASRTVPVTNFSSAILGEILADNTGLSNADGTVTDWVEIYNPSSNAFTLANCSLSDDPAAPRRWVFPAGASLAPGDRVLVRCDSAAAATTTNGPVLNTGFGLNAAGDAVYLYNPAQTLVDSIIFGPQAANFSIARVPDNGTNWVLAIPSPGSDNLAATLAGAAGLRINEWEASVNGGPDWFEIYNPQEQPVSLGGHYLTDKLNNRTKHLIAPLTFVGVGTNGYTRFVADNDTVQGPNHVGFSLDATLGEAIGIFPPGTGPEIDTVAFGPQTVDVSEGRFPDGTANRVFFGKPSPGEANWLMLTNVVINEVLSHTDPPLEDALELYNTTASPVDISGWFLSDDGVELFKYRIPDGTIIPPHGYRVFYEYQLNPEPGAGRSFSFSSAQGDDAWLTAADPAGAPTGYRHYVKFGPQFNGISFGRYQTSLGPEFVALSALSFGSPVTAQSPVEQIGLFRTGAGAANPYPRMGPVVISEIMYHPPPIGTNDNVRDEYIELHNITGAPVALYAPLHTTNGWKLRDAVDFTFNTSHTIPANGYLMVVSFDPATNAAARAAFRSVYGTNGILVGPYSGKLDNGGESVELVGPDNPQTTIQDFGVVPYVMIDKVVYADLAPWPLEADGLGAALRRLNLAGYGNDPLNWAAASPSVGSSGLADSDGDSIPDDWEDSHGLNKLVNDASLDPDRDGFTNLQEYIAGTDPQSQASCLRFEGARQGPAGIDISFYAAVGRTYSVLYLDQFGSGNWQKLADVPARATPQVITVTDSTALTSSGRYYRLVTPVVP